MPTGLYLHFPFCISKCRYCDFNSRVAPVQLRRRYLAALLQELKSRLSQTAPVELATVFFGGGTPTIYSPDELGRVLATAVASGRLETNAEVTCEANPDTVNPSVLQQLRSVGFNRISLGVQSLSDEQLALLGRSHNAAAATHAVQAARECFDNLSVDLIYGIPGQTPEAWEETLVGTVALQPDHISAYGLMIEPETALHSMVASGKLEPPSDEQYAELYDLAQRLLSQVGYEQYEISNYARPRRRCRHNLLYWRNQHYLGCGAGAAAYMHGFRSINIADPLSYCEAVEADADATESEEHLESLQWAGETVMLGLRTIEGVNLRVVSEQCGTDLETRHRDLILALVARGMAEYEAGLLRLTPDRGFLLHSQVARRFLA